MDNKQLKQSMWLKQNKIGNLENLIESMGQAIDCL